MKSMTQPTTAPVKAPRRKSRKAAEVSLSQRIARLSASPQKELSRAMNPRMLTAKLRKTLIGIAPQQILALAMMVVAVSIVERPALDAAGVLNSRFHISPTAFALVMVICGAILLLRPRSAAFVILSLPFVLYIAAGILYYTSGPYVSFTAPVLYTTLYLVILRVALKG